MKIFKKDDKYSYPDSVVTWTLTKFQESIITGSHTKIEYCMLLENKSSVLRGTDLKKR